MDFRGARSGCHSNVTEIKAVIFLTFPFIFARFGRFGGFGRFGRFGGFGRFGRFVSVVPLVSVVSFRPFRFVVSGFSTCRFQGVVWAQGLGCQWVNSNLFNLNNNDNVLFTYSVFLGKQFFYNVAAVFKLLR